MNYLVLVSCLGLATSTLSSCCACFQYLQLSSYLPTWKLLHKAESSRKLESDVGTESIWYPWLSGTWDFPAESLTVLTCTEPGADGEGKLICQLLSRPAWAEEFAVVALDVWSARELCFLDIWRKFPCIWAVFMIGLGRVSGEEQSESY